MLRTLTVAIVVGFVIFLSAPNVLACSCSERPTIPRALDYADVVVTGRIESVQKIRNEEVARDIGAYRSATLLVEKAYSGNVKVGDRLVLAQGSGADCAFTWNDESVGGRWLFYLGKPSTDYYRYLIQDGEEITESEKVPMYRTSFCGRSTTIDDAAVDLAYWDNLAKRKDKTRVSGTLGFGERPVEGIEVRVTGRTGQFKTRYVKAGFFEFYDLPPGEYVVEMFPPRGWKTEKSWRDSYPSREFDEETLKKLKKNQQIIRVETGGHVDVNLELVPDTMIKGRVLSPTNKPMANIWITAVPVNESDRAAQGRTKTDASGSFQFESLPPGNYFLIANPEGKIDDERPFGRLYYPGVVAAESAGLVSVEAGNYALGRDIQVPQIVRLIEISGRVVFADETPGKDIWLSFVPRDIQRFERISARAGEDGRFALKIPFGTAGVLAGASYYSRSRHAKCPEIISALGTEDYKEIQTTSVEITGLEPISGAVLSFPFDFCDEK